MHAPASALAGGATTYTLIYRAGTGGTISGVATQEVAAGKSGTAVSAVVEDTAATFARWSDGNTTATRTDTNVQSDRHQHHDGGVLQADRGTALT